MATTTHDLNELKRRMQGALHAFKQELSGLRTGRATTAMLDPVQVEAYGTHMPLNQLATVSVPEPRLISVQVWDRSMVHPVEKAIINANLGLSPATEGQVLRLRIPELNEERRKQLANATSPVKTVPRERRVRSPCGANNNTAIAGNGFGGPRRANVYISVR